MTRHLLPVLLLLTLASPAALAQRAARDAKVPSAPMVESFPILPYIFFDSASATPEERYLNRGVTLFVLSPR